MSPPVNDYAARIMIAMQAERDALGLIGGKPLPVEARDRVLNAMVPLFIEEATKQVKARNKAAIDERSAGVLNVYPRRQGGDAALAAISKAIQRDGYEAVISGTTEYAAAVARWSYGRRFSQSGSSLIPLPTTWFGNRCYFDDPKVWWEGTGGKQKAVEKPKLSEPHGWRSAHPESRFVTEGTPWAAIDETSQKWIIEHTSNQRSA